MDTARYRRLLKRLTPHLAGLPLLSCVGAAASPCALTSLVAAALVDTVSAAVVYPSDYSRFEPLGHSLLKYGMFIVFALKG